MIMRWTLLTLAALALVAQAQIFPTAAPAQDAPGESVSATTETRTQALENELASLHSQYGPYEGPVGPPGYACSAGGCGCNVCACNPCGSCCRMGGLYGGVELLWIKPHFEDEAAFVIDGSLIDTAVPFNYDYDMAPRFWLGYVGSSGLGARARYWFYDDGGAASGTFVDDGEAFAFGAGDMLRRRLAAGPGDTAHARHDIELETLDLEATQQWDRRNLTLLGGAGLRYVRAEQDYLVEFSDPLAGTNSLLHNHSFEGYGPTAALELWRPFSGYGLSLYGGLRGSVLFGNVNQRITETTGPNTFIERRDDVDESLAIGEVALGLQWTGAGFYNTDLFVRGGWEGQYWHGIGTANSTEGDMGLQGFSVAFGVLR